MIKFFAGDNTFELKQALESEVASFVKQHGDLAIERFDADETETAVIIDAVLSVSFLSPAKMVIVHASNKDLLEKLIELEVPDTTTAIVVITKLDKRASYYKKLQKHSGLTLFENVTSQRLPEWVRKQVAENGGDISPSDARYLIDRVGANQLMLGNEIEKLLLFNKHISKQTIDELTEPIPQTTVFQLMDAAFAGKATDALNIYKEQRAQKVEPHAIVGMIAWQLHILALLKTAGDRSPDVVAKEAKLNPYVVKKSSAIARRISLADIKRLIKDAVVLDKTIKTSSVNPDEAVKTYLVKLAIS